MAGLDLTSILGFAVKQNASDVHLKAGMPPILRLNGRLVPIKNHERLAPVEVANAALAIMNEGQKETFRRDHQVDLAYSVPGLGRFRVNIFNQRGAAGIVFRVIPIKILSFEELHLPEVFYQIAEEMRGLILVTGVTGSGKSTTLASILDYINNKRSAHIISIEDPIEFLHKDKFCLINQREIGFDATSFAEALRGALRQDPDIIMVGEMRDKETIETALTAAETGHLVLSTLHTIDAVETINRIVTTFPPYQQKQIRIQLASVVKAIISQRLIPTSDGSARVPAVEILRSTARVRECIEDKDKTKELFDAISKGHSTYGMQSFDQSILSLLKKGYISYEEAMRQASNQADFELKVKGVVSTGDTNWEGFDKASAGESAEGEKEEETAADMDDIERF